MLLMRGERVRLGPKVVQTLEVLLDHVGELVTKEQLMNELWPSGFVEEGNITQNIHRLRRVLGDGGLSGAIETIPRRGYRFILPEDSTSHRMHAVRSPKLIAWIACLVFLFVAFGTVHFDHMSKAYDRLSSESKRLYSIGRYHWNHSADLAQVHESLPYFFRVINLDPKNPLGYSGLADAYLAIFDARCDSQVSSCPRIAAAATLNAEKAVAVDPRSAEARTSLAMVRYDINRRFAPSDAEFRRAIALDGDYALAHHWYANSLVVRGKLAEAEEQYRIALSLEPTSPGANAWLAQAEYLRRQYRAAIVAARTAVEIDAHRPMTWIVLGLSYEQLGDGERAASAFAHLPAWRRSAYLAGLAARRGQRGTALAVLGRLPLGESGVEAALAWDTLGNPRRAAAILAATVPGNWIDRSLLALDPHLARLHSSPQFNRLSGSSG